MRVMILVQGNNGSLRCGLNSRLTDNKSDALPTAPHCPWITDTLFNQVLCTKTQHSTLSKTELFIIQCSQFFAKFLKHRFNTNMKTNKHIFLCFIQEWIYLHKAMTFPIWSLYNYDTQLITMDSLNLQSSYSIN